MTLNPAQTRKALVAVAAFVTNLVALGALPDYLVPYAVALISALAAVGVYFVPNAEVPEYVGEHRADV